MIGVSTLRSDLTQCDLEPITRPERIQSFGFLLAVSREWQVISASANLAEFLGIDPLAALGVELDLLVNPEALHAIRNRMTGLSSLGGIERIYGVSLIVGRPRVDIAVHYAERFCILEGEPAGGDSQMDAASLVRSMMARLGKDGAAEIFHHNAARQIRSMTGFERVMIYQFAEDGTGNVIAEVAKTGADSYLGLHFPASDIPVQARSLYLLNPFRIIADVNSAAVPLVTSEANAVQPLDLSQAITRAVSPVHLEYLRNMDVQASLSISIIVNGALWGLIACHNPKPCLPTFVVRTAAELFGQLFSMTLESRQRHAEQEQDRSARETTIRLVTSIAGNHDLLRHASWMQDQLQTILPGDGVSVSFGGHRASSGLTLASADVEAIAQAVTVAPIGSITASDNIRELLPHSRGSLDLVAGVLCIPLSQAGDHVLVFRKEWIHEIEWAGKPVKAEVRGEEIPRISPRKSFAAFKESVRGRSRPFSLAEQRYAEELRVGLVQVLPRESLTIDIDRKRVIERQEILIAELNHRVRNVLALIRGLISQTQGEDGDAASYVSSLSGRVQALARAHDRVTRQNWGPGPLNSIFEDEISAYVPMQRHRFSIKGAQIMLQPQAFSTLALVIHELVTNASKYGCLSDGGRVEVTLEHTVGTGLFMKWRELDGPAVQIPTRRGFGSVILERVVPFDLQGTALVQFFPKGVEADFFIPDRHIASSHLVGLDLSSIFAADMSMAIVAPASALPLNGRGVLLLEDNLIVALEAEDMLRALGAASIHTASTVAVATRFVETVALDFAVLDVNLGFETSLDFASQLRERGIRFIFASGYGDNIDIGGVNSSVVTISKPYDRDQLNLAIVRTLANPSAARPHT
jgi:light-regulated signal transduction histidine kinase (bacteriophytochrome)/ActR/RegA family two-component response regulator